MSKPLRPYRLQPARLLCPWDFPGQEYWSGLPFPSPTKCLYLSSMYCITLNHIEVYFQFSSVAQSCPTLCDPTLCKPGLPVHHQLPEFTQTHVHLILCRPLLLPPSVFPSIRVFSNESVLRISWPNYWSFSFSISTSNEYLGLFYFT